MCALEHGGWDHQRASKSAERYYTTSAGGRPKGPLCGWFVCGCVWVCVDGGWVGVGVRMKRALLQWLLRSVATVGAAPVDVAVAPVAAVAVAATHPME